MTNAEQERYQALFAMFETDGYNFMMSDIDRDIEMIDNIMAAKDEGDLNFRKGLLTTLMNLRHFAENTRKMYEAAQEQGTDQ